MTYYDSLKNAVSKTVESVTKTFVSPPKVSAFFDKGTLTPEEYVQAGNKLISMCGSWKWFPAVNPKYETQYLPKDKQFIGIQNIISKQRVADLISANNIDIKEDENGDIIIERLNKVSSEPNLMQTQQPEEQRFYTLYVVYDLYYFTPKLFLAGVDEQGVPMTYDQIKQDIMAEYADKTVTKEYHPHLNEYLATIHPCKHADTLKSLSQQMLENGADQSKVHADNAVLIFLKFMGSVIPTIEFDFVSDIMIG